MTTDATPILSWGRAAARRDRIRRVAFYQATRTPLWLGLVRSVRLTAHNSRALHPTR